MSGTNPIILSDDPTLGEIVEAVTLHNEQFPQHGIACSCLDVVTSAIRNATTIGKLKERLDDHDLWKAQSRVDYVMVVGNTNRP